jgi:glucokinase
VDVVGPLTERFGVPVALQNDANACALAEWRWGAGRGARNMIFLTFGTGMGAGLILDGRLYSGTNDLRAKPATSVWSMKARSVTARPGRSRAFAAGADRPPGRMRAEQRWRPASRGLLRHSGRSTPA